MLLLFPIGALVANSMGNISKKMMSVTDKRVKFLNEVGSTTPY